MITKYKVEKIMGKRNIQTGDVIVFNWNANSFLGRAIQKFNQAYYYNKGWAHAAIVVQKKGDQYWLYLVC